MDYMQVKTTLNGEESNALMILGGTNCSGVKCEYCPFMLENTDGRCLRTLANEVMNKMKYEPSTKEAFILSRM